LAGNLIALNDRNTTASFYQFHGGHATCDAATNDDDVITFHII
jgi:hypothetical protein